MSFLYNIFVRCLILGLNILAFFNEKVRKGIQGRKESFSRVKQKINQKDEVIWMHAASLGEYEQGLPVLQELKSKHPECKIIISFFSPSGYEIIQKKNTIADVVVYIPFDTKNNIREFCRLFKTKIFFTVKYDYWYHLLDELRNLGTKIYVVSALFYDKQVFFKSYGSWFVKKLKKNVDCFFHQTQNSFDLAQKIGLKNSIVSGDTRFDRVKQLRERNNYVEYIQEFKQDKKLVVVGSSWESEENVAECLSEKAESLKIVLAPHDLKRVGNVKALLGEEVLFYSKRKTYSPEKIEEAKVLVVDSIGLLSKLYSYADLAIVGGGFHSKGLHNILEAATFGIPVFFGNQYKKNPEADLLIENQAAKSFGDEKSLCDFVLELIEDEELLKQMSKNAEKIVTSQPNSTQIILDNIKI